MPHINSLRLVNVHFNNATQFYDDFKMELGGLNTTYDLENGGGKSVLLLMILQTVLPKSFLRREKPVSLLFQGGKERTSHVAVEWIMEEGSGYKYLLTGFCARKRRGASEPALKEASDEEVVLQSADIEHLNWCVFYNDHKTTGINSVPFYMEEAGKKTYAGFDQIRRFIQQMRQKGLPAEVFDGIDRYQSYILAHNLIAAEWNINRGINSGENSIESYFRQNTTSRKLIENQFVKIVEDVEALNKGNQSNHESLLLADTLIEIRSRLNEYLRLKGHMAEYEKTKQYYSEFEEKNRELGQVFQQYEAHKLQAAAIRNRIASDLETLGQERKDNRAKMESSTTGCDEGRQLKSLLEAGLVSFKKEMLLADSRRLEMERDRLAQNQSDMENNLNRLLTLEAYGEYRRVKQKTGEIRIRLKTMTEQEDALQDAYRAAGGKLKFLTGRQLEELKMALGQALESERILRKEKYQNQQSLIREEKRSSVLEADIERLRQDEVEAAEKLQELNAFFLNRGEIDAVLMPEQFSSQLKNDSDQYSAEEDIVNNKIETLNIGLRNLDLEAVKSEGEINNKTSIRRQIEDWLNTYRQERSGLEKKAAGFGTGTLGEYREQLEALTRKESLDRLEKEIEKGRMQQKKQLSEDRGYYVPNEEILSLTGQLSAKCEFVKAGIDWIADCTTEEKSVIIGEMPFLPFSVIVDRLSFEKLVNGRLKLDFTSDYPVPVVNLETVRSQKNAGPEELYYYCGFAGLLMDKEKYEQYLQGLEAQLHGIDREISTAETRICELVERLSEVDAFYARYTNDEFESRQALFKQVGNELEALKQCQNDNARRRDDILEEKKILTERIGELAGLMSDCREKAARITEIIQTGEELRGIRKDLDSRQGELKTVAAAIDGVKEAALGLEQRDNDLAERLDQVKIQLHDLSKEQEQLSSFTTIENTMPVDQVRAEYSALHQAVRGRDIEEDRLRNDLNDAQERLEALKTRIHRDYGGNLAEIDKSEESGTLILVPTQELIEKARRDKDKNSEELKAAQERVEQISKQIEKAEGRLEFILESLGDAIRNDLPHYGSELRYKQEIAQVEILIDSYEKELRSLNEQSERIKEAISRLNFQAEEYSAFIENEAVVDYGGIAPEAMPFREFEKEHRRLRDIIRGQCDIWDDRLKIIQAETAAFTIREPLEELAKISRPVSSTECLARNEAFVEYIANIEEQMQKINYDILQLEQYQQGFTRRCIQRAELVLEHLKKLESLSRIEVYGRRIHMIELRLPELEDKEKHLRMKNHIAGIVREINTEGLIDRKRVAARLSTKELLAQITDMDKAAVRLYKIESIPENSRFYRWESAIGSEGQNNSLYFIFAACLISFIRMLSITNSTVRTKKVIIADNPFGSTSAYYLWDPMFKIMKQNDIQLIAPGHRIPREIISRFGVSYLLNQDILQDGRMRVVVKDVRVEENEDFLRFELEPLSLF